MEELKNELKQNRLGRLYLFYGEERYLVRHYEGQVRKAAGAGSPAGGLMNVSVFSEKEAAADIIAACETLPFLSERRLVIVKDSGLFAAGRKDDSERMRAYLADAPETALILFSESEVDKRGRLFKAVSELGRAVEFKTQPEGELIKWLCNIFRKYGNPSGRGAAFELIKTAGLSMDALYAEALKLIAYRAGEEIGPADIELVCVKPLETRIFDLVAAIGNKDAAKALGIYANMLLYKESPIMILVMVARQIRLLLQTKRLLAENGNQAGIASALGLAPFIARELCAQAKNFSEETLFGAFFDCLRADENIKTGRMADKLAVETLIVKYGRA